MSKKKKNSILLGITAVAVSGMLTLSNLFMLTGCAVPMLQGEQGIPGIQGEKGDKGDTGAQGEKGDKGDTGAQGEKGDKGDTGAQGEKGDKGDAGAQGEKGDKGDAGAQGEKGDKGDAGAQGEKGDKGDTGAQGEKGDKGDKGDTGKGILSVEKTGSSGRIDYYCMTFTDGTQFGFQIENGTSSESGSSGTDTVRRWTWALYDAEAVAENYHVGQEYSTTTGKLVAGNAAYMYSWTDLIPVNPGEDLTISATGIQCLAYDKNGVFVSAIKRDGYIMHIPADGVAFVRFQWCALRAKPAVVNVFRDGYGLSLKFNSNMTYDSGFPMLSSDDMASLTGLRNYLGINSFGDHEFAFIGDSFTSPGIWVNDVCSNLGVYKYRSEARDGAAFTSYPGVTRTAYQQAQRLVSGGYHPDVIVITLSLNDASNKAPLGRFVDSPRIEDYDLTTYWGGMQACLTYLQQSYPKARILVGWTPMSSWNMGTADEGSTDFSGGNAKYLAAMKDCCIRYGITYIETRTCGVSRLSGAFDEYFAGKNDVHPSVLGHHRIGQYMTMILRSTGGYVDPLG